MTSKHQILFQETDARSNTLTLPQDEPVRSCIFCKKSDGDNLREFDDCTWLVVKAAAEHRLRLKTDKYRGATTEINLQTSPGTSFQTVLQEFYCSKKTHQSEQRWTSKEETWDKTKEFHSSRWRRMYAERVVFSVEKSGKLSTRNQTLFRTVLDLILFRKLWLPLHTPLMIV